MTSHTVFLFKVDLPVGFSTPIAQREQKRGLEFYVAGPVKVPSHFTVPWQVLPITVVCEGSRMALREPWLLTSAAGRSVPLLGLL